MGFVSFFKNIANKIIGSFIPKDILARSSEEL